MKYSKKIIENTVRHWERMLNEARVYDDIFEQLVDMAMRRDDIPNWMKIPEFASELRGFIVRPVNKVVTPDYYITILHKQICNRVILKYDIDQLNARRLAPIKKKIPFIFNAATKDWSSFRQLDPGFNETQFLLFPLWYCRFSFFPRLDDGLIKKYKGKRYGQYNDDCLFEISNPNSIDASRICLPGTNEIKSIDENGVIS